jgi:hypothetical protein
LAILIQRQEALLQDLLAQSTAGFDKAKEEWEKSVAVWGGILLFFPFFSLVHELIVLSVAEKRQEKVKAEAEAASADGGSTTAAAPVERQPT